MSVTIRIKEVRWSRGVGSNPARDNGSRRKGADFATDYSTLREKDFMYQSGAI